VTLVTESDLVHVVSEDDRDDAEDLAHRLRFVVNGVPADWTNWDEISSYRVRTAIPLTVEAQSKDLEGHVGSAVIEIEPPEAKEESVGPNTVAEDGTEDKRWEDESTQPDDGVREPADPEISPYTTGDTPWDTELHGECPPPSCATTPTARSSWPAVAILLFVSAGLLTRRRRRAASS
jgi:hypothetical protein